MEYPNSELEYWAAFFSIDDNEDKPMLKTYPENITVEDSISDLKRVLGS